MQRSLNNNPAKRMAAEITRLASSDVQNQESDKKDSKQQGLALAVSLLQLLACKAFDKSFDQLDEDGLITVLLNIEATNAKKRAPYALGLCSVLEKEQYSLLIKKLIAYEANKAQHDITLFMRSDSMLTALMAQERRASMYSSKRRNLSIRGITKDEMTFFEEYMKPSIRALIQIVKKNYAEIIGDKWSIELCEKFTPILQNYLNTIFKNGTNNQLPDFVFKNAYEIREALEAKTKKSVDNSDEEGEYLSAYRNNERHVSIKVGGYVNLRFLNGLSCDYIQSKITNTKLRDACHLCLTYVLNVPIQNMSNRLEDDEADSADWKPQQHNEKFVVWEQILANIMPHRPHDNVPVSYRTENLLHEHEQKATSVLTVDLADQSNQSKTWSDIIRKFLLTVSSRANIILSNDTVDSIRKRNEIRKLLQNYENDLAELWVKIQQPEMVDLLDEGDDSRDEDFASHPLVKAIMSACLEEVTELLIKRDQMCWSMTNSQSETLLSLAIKTLVGIQKSNRDLSFDSDKWTLLSSSKEIFHLVLCHVIRSGHEIYSDETEIKNLNVDLDDADTIYIKRTLECACRLQLAFTSEYCSGIADACYLDQAFVTFFLAYNCGDGKEKNSITEKIISAAFLISHENGIRIAEKLFRQLQNQESTAYCDLTLHEKGKEKSTTLFDRIKLASHGAPPPAVPPFEFKNRSEMSVGFFPPPPSSSLSIQRDPASSLSQLQTPEIEKQPIRRGIVREMTEKLMKKADDTDSASNQFGLRNDVH